MVLANPAAEFETDVANQPLVDGGVVRVLQARAKGAAAEGHFLWSGEPFGGAATLGPTEGIPGAELDFGEAVLASAGTVDPTATVGTGPSVAPVLTATGPTAARGPGSNFHFTTDSTSDAIGGGDQVRLVTGPNSLYVAYVRPGDEAVAAQHFNGVAFEPAVAISPAGVQGFAISKDSAGLLHLAYGGFDGFHYRYATDGSNTNFSNPQTLPEHAYREMRIAVTAAGDGWLSYSDDDHGHDLVLPLPPVNRRRRGRERRSDAGEARETAEERRQRNADARRWSPPTSASPPKPASRPRASAAAPPCRSRRRPASTSTSAPSRRR